jgi:hypothetical protein
MTDPDHYPYGHLSQPEAEAEARAKVAAADTPTALLRLCLPAVSYDASTGVIAAKELLAKIREVLNREEGR